MNKCQINVSNGLLMFTSPYEPMLVKDLKRQVPPTARKWDGIHKAWIVDPAYGNILVFLAKAYCGDHLTLPAIQQAVAKTEMRLLDVRYVGQCKERGDGSKSAFGYSKGDWSVIFSEEVLRTWFEAGPAEPGQASTLYGVLTLNQKATPDEIKSAFRRLARQWHPDICHEPGADEQFKQINHAYQILSDSKMRGRYDAGLQLAATLDKTDYRQLVSGGMQAGGYRSPLRCGYVMVEGVEKMGRIAVEKILKWEDITSGDKTLVTYWPMGAKAPMEQWV